jgi:hypothetical protein
MVVDQVLDTIMLDDLLHVGSLMLGQSNLNGFPNATASPGWSVSTNRRTPKKLKMDHLQLRL